VRPHTTERGLIGTAGCLVSARDRACLHENGRASSRMTQRSHHWVERHHRGRHLDSPRRNVGELNSVEEQKEKGLGFFPF
jgi:hypothetical protein